MDNFLAFCSCVLLDEFSEKKINIEQIENRLWQRSFTRNETPTSMVVAPVELRCGSSMDSNIPLPQRAAKRSTNGRISENDLRIVLVLEYRKKSWLENRYLLDFDLCREYRWSLKNLACLLKQKKNYLIVKTTYIFPGTNGRGPSRYDI